MAGIKLALALSFVILLSLSRSPESSASVLEGGESTDKKGKSGIHVKKSGGSGGGGRGGGGGGGGQGGGNRGGRGGGGSGGRSRGGGGGADGGGDGYVWPGGGGKPNNRTRRSSAAIGSDPSWNASIVCSCLLLIVLLAFESLV